MMNTSSILMLTSYFLLLLGAGALLGLYMARALDGSKGFLHGMFEPIENLFLKLAMVKKGHDMDWKEYAISLLVFNFLGMIFLFLILKFQHLLGMNPENRDGLSFWLAANTAISFVTNTNWQAYSGESSLSYLSQMLGLTVQNFLSAATGIAVAVALIRGLRQKSGKGLGNFWIDLIRIVVRLLLPLSFLLALFLVNEGSIQNFLPSQKVVTLEKAEQTVPMGPVASQIAIKQLGTNGGGYFGANGAHPFENPTPLSNFIQLITILLLPLACVFMYGKMMGHWKQGLMILMAMLIVFAIMLALSLYAEHLSNPMVFNLPFWEGKEWRFSITETSLWSVATTAASNGSVNGMHSSLSPLGGFVCIFNMMLGEIIFGGVGSGLYGMVLFVLLTVFLAGLMVGRTPEYLGKKIEASEIIWVAVAVLAPGLVNLLFSALAAILPAGLSALSHDGPHGLSEILYAFSSALGNNGSAFAGLNADNAFYNGLTGLGMLIGRYVVIVPTLAVAGNLAAKKIIPPSLGTLPTESVLFVFLLISVIIIVGALTFFPALVLAPLAEHFLLYLH